MSAYDLKGFLRTAYRPFAYCLWTVPQLSIIIIYNSTWSILIQWIRNKLSCDNLTQKTQKKDPFTSLHKIKANLPLWAEFEILRNGALSTPLNTAYQGGSPSVKRKQFMVKMVETSHIFCGFYQFVSCWYVVIITVLEKGICACCGAIIFIYLYCMVKRSTVNLSQFSRTPTGFVDNWSGDEKI